MTSTNNLAISSCCKSSMHTSTSDEGTSYYVCNNCRKPADIYASYNPLPPEGCTCASFWTVRQAHRSDCPLREANKTPEIEKVEAAVREARVSELKMAREHISMYNLTPLQQLQGKTAYNEYIKKRLDELQKPQRENQ